MRSTLAEILEAEKNARQKLSEAEEYKQRTIEKAEAEKKQIYETEARSRSDTIEAIKLKYEKISAEKVKQIETAANQRIVKSKNFSNGKTEEWAQAIFENVISFSDR